MAKVLWFDFENTPHVWILKEIINYFNDEGYKILITSRQNETIKNLSKFLNINVNYFSYSRVYKSKFLKVIGIISRALDLVNFVLKNNTRPSIAISHGSRSQAFAAALLSIPVISLDDYEYSSKLFNLFVDKLLTPFPIPKEEWGIFNRKVINYPGLKEELYLWNDNNYLNELHQKSELILSDKINVIFRPEGYLAHYRSSKSKELQNLLIDYFTTIKNINIILLSRDKIQEKEIENRFKEKNIPYTKPFNVLNGPALIFNSDLIIGGGGTMTREGAILNTPAYSFFGGRTGHVDKYLIESGKLFLIKKEEDILNIKFYKKEKQKPFIKKDAFNFVVNFIKDLIN